jgi:3-deoxy-D-manno-octulosonate 8-phosphate phosphatase KdsC-like HAD superfamily phosphatase
VGYICKNKGGDGVVREYLDFILGRPEELLI